MEKVIFREDYDEYKDVHGYVAVLPQQPANRGRVVAIFFYFEDDGRAWFDSFDEWDINYVLSKKIVHKWDPRIPMLVEAMSNQFDMQFVVVERLQYK